MLVPIRLGGSSRAYKLVCLGFKKTLMDDNGGRVAHVQRPWPARGERSIASLDSGPSVRPRLETVAESAWAPGRAALREWGKPPGESLVGSSHLMEMFIYLSSHLSIQPAIHHPAHTPIHLCKAMHLQLPGFPGGSVVKNRPANAGDVGDAGSIPGSGR